MGATIRILCVECLRSAEVPRTSDEMGSGPLLCEHCGAPLGSDADEPTAATADYETPISLALTPEEQVLWWGEPSSATASSVPETIGRFQLRELLGGGGFGQVYRAYDPRLEREVALKILRNPSPTARVMERFFREARAAAQLDHPNIVPLHDAGRDQGRCWIAYQYVRGPTLASYRDGVVLAPQEAVRIARALAEALAHAHQHGVFHRDIKPANVILDPSGRPRLTDFGLARRLDVDPLVTREGTVLGTPAYMSPEQANGRSHQADARSDLYSLGVVLYELLCGLRPTDAPSGTPAWRLPTGQPPLPPDRRRPGIPRPLSKICLRALAPNPSDRYPDAEALAGDLTRWLDRPQATWQYPAALAAGLAAGLVITWARGDARTPPSGPVLPATTPATPARNAPKVRSLARGVAKGTSATARLEPSYVGDSGSSLYHRAGCPATAAATSKTTPTPLAWPTRAEPEATGRRPCKLCLSPTSHPSPPEGESHSP